MNNQTPKNILLTGGTGFVGSFLLEKLVENHNVIVAKRSTSNMDKIKHITSKNMLQFIDIDTNCLEEVFATGQLDIVTHMATSYGRKGETPSDILQSALVLPIKLLDLTKKYNIPVFINTDSYFNQSIQLQDNIGTHAEAKRDFLKYAKKIIEDTNITFCNVVMGHVYGPKDHEKKLVPAMIYKLLENQPVIDLVKGDNPRNFVYVKDLIRVYMMIIDNIENMQSQYQDFYDRTGEVVTVREMVELLKKITGSTSQFNFGAVPDRENEIMHICPDMNSLTHKLGWAPEYNIEQGLTETVDYYKNLSHSE